MKDNSLQNAAYSTAYKKQKAKYLPLFADNNKKDLEEIFLNEKYKILKIKYAGVVEGCNLHGSTCILTNKKEEEIHSWKSVDDSSDFYELVNHQNGKQYLVYRQDLYGYSVFELSSKAEFQYYPQRVLDGMEYFIWTNINYNPSNNLLAISGCIWAAPWGTLLVDFSDPLNVPKFQIDITECIEGGYDVYDDIDFVRWEDKDIVVKCFNTEKEVTEMKTVTSDTYLKYT